MIGQHAPPAPPWRRKDPAAFVVAYTFSLIGILAASGYAAAHIGVNPAWLVLAAIVVISVGGLAVIALSPRDHDDDDED